MADFLKELALQISSGYFGILTPILLSCFVGSPWRYIKHRTSHLYDVPATGEHVTNVKDELKRELSGLKNELSDRIAGLERIIQELASLVEKKMPAQGAS